MMPVGMIASDLALPATPRGVDEQRRLSGKSPIEVAREFEALLVAQMIAAMRRTVGSGGLLEASAARRVLDGAFDHEVARSLTARGDFGIAPQLMVQLARRGVPPVAATSGELPKAVDGHYSNEPLGAWDVPETGPKVVREITSVHARESAVTASAAVSVTAGRASEGWSTPSVRVSAAAPVLPVDGPVTSSFGVRRDPLSGAQRFHAGVDIAVPRGTPIRAVAPGEVVFSGWRGASGNVVEVRHGGGLITSYAHAERTLVGVGEKVAVGDVLATVGSSGRSTAPHLHFTVRKNGQPIDPALLFGRSRPHVGALPGAGEET